MDELKIAELATDVLRFLSDKQFDVQVKMASLNVAIQSLAHAEQLGGKSKPQQAGKFL